MVVGAKSAATWKKGSEIKSWKRHLNFMKSFWRIEKKEKKFQAFDQSGKKPT